MDITMLGLIMGLLGAGFFLIFAHRLDVALVFTSLVWVCWRDEYMETGEWWAFWIAFVIALLLTLRRRSWTGRQRIGVGLAMLLFAVVLASDWEFLSPVEDVWGWIMSIFIILAVALVTFLLVGVAGAVVLVAAVTAVVLALGGMVGFFFGDTRSPAGPSVASPTATTTPTTTATVTVPVGTGTPTGVACPPKFRQDFDPNKLNRYVSVGIDAPKPEESRLKDLSYLAHDARYLAIQANQGKLWPNRDPSKLLEPGNKCLSREGQDLWNQVKGAFMAKGVKVEFRDVPANWYNTGIKDGKMVVEDEPGITGNRKALVYTFPDGTKIIKLVRCANLVFPSQPPGVPEGPTDNPPKPKPTPKATPTPKPSRTTPPVTGKDPSKDPLVNPSVPAVVKGTAPAPKPEYTQPAKPPEPPATYKPPPAPTATVAPSSTPRPTYSTPPPQEDPEPSHTSAPPPPPDW